MNAQLPGELAYVFVVSILDAILLSWAALAWYRRSVSRLMRVRGAGTSAVSTVGSSSIDKPATTPPAQIAFALYDSVRSSDGRGTGWRTPVDVKRIAIAYGVAAALYSAVVTAFQLGDERPALPFAAWFGMWWINAWPVVPTLAILLLRDRRGAVQLALGYVLAAAAGVSLVTFLLQVFRGAFNTAPITNVYWLVAGLLATAWLPLALLWLIGWRRIRAAAPLALAATLAFGFGSLAFREAMIRGFNLPAFRSAFLEAAVLSSTDVAYYGLFMLASLPVGWVAWRILRWLAGAFEKKQFSDVQLTIDCWWVVVTAESVATSLSQDYGLAAVAIGLAAFAVYRGTVAVVLRLPREQQPLPSGRRLLLLRVFGYEARTESLFDRVAQLWRFAGPVQLIAGVDLATRTTDPGDILSFLRGDLAARYVASENEIPQRIQALDCARDPDGRHRVNELYCHDDTWRAVLQALLDTTDIVLMDLRSFSAQNSGCVFELQQIVRRVASDNIVLTCDGTTDLALLGRILADAWNMATAEGSARGTGEIAIVRLKTGKQRELAVLMRRLIGLAKPDRLFRPAELPAALV